MTHDEIIRMAQTCGFSREDHHAIYAMLARFAELVAAAEREACAKTVEDMEHGNVRTCAAAIRARSNA